MVEVVTAELERGLIDPIGSRGHMAGCDETPKRRLRKLHSAAVDKVKLLLMKDLV